MLWGGIIGYILLNACCSVPLRWLSFFVIVFSVFVCLLTHVMCVVTFFCGKKSNQKKPPEKKASVFSGWCYYGRQCYCAARLIGSDGFHFLL